MSKRYGLLRLNVAIGKAHGLHLLEAVLLRTLGDFICYENARNGRPPWSGDPSGSKLAAHAKLCQTSIYKAKNLLLERDVPLVRIRTRPGLSSLWTVEITAIEALSDERLVQRDLVPVPEDQPTTSSRCASDPDVHVPCDGAPVPCCGSTPSPREEVRAGAELGALSPCEGVESASRSGPHRDTKNTSPRDAEKHSKRTKQTITKRDCGNDGAGEAISMLRGCGVTGRKCSDLAGGHSVDEIRAAIRMIDEASPPQEHRAGRIVKALEDGDVGQYLKRLRENESNRDQRLRSRCLIGLYSAITHPTPALRLRWSDRMPLFEESTRLARERWRSAQAMGEDLPVTDDELHRVVQNPEDIAHLVLQRMQPTNESTACGNKAV